MTLPIRLLSLAAGLLLVAGCNAPPEPPAPGTLARPSLAALPPAGHTPPAGFLTLPVGICTFMPSLCDTGPKLLPGESEVTSFGSNPGKLRMFRYVPANLGTSRPLVVALHGCTQSIASYDDETGWTQLADKFRFALLMPQQNSANNSLKCFRWFDANQNQRDKGEALSIKQMVDTMLADTALNIDRNKVYVTGLSGGAGMAIVMMATYPELFAGGAPIAGIPYGCAQTDQEATSNCGVSLSTPQGSPANTPMRQLTPAEWGDRVRSASTVTGPFHRLAVSIWQGTADHIVNPADEAEVIKQWVNVLGANPTPLVDEQFRSARHQVFQDNAGQPVVEAFVIKDMDHGTPIDPGPGNDQCGTSSHDQFIIDAGICSSFYIAKFWGLASD